MELPEVNSLAKKLLIKKAQRWLFIQAPQDFPKSFASLNVEIETAISADHNFNGILLFVKNRAELMSALPEITAVLTPEIIFWLAYPKKSSGISSDLEMTKSWGNLEEIGWQTVASVAIDKTWTALRFKPKAAIKASGISNAEIQNNELAAFIDTKNKKITLPEDIKQVLEKEPEVYAIYQKLTYSHQKEYVIWILSARQEKTRTSRVEKMVEKLLQRTKDGAILP